jgi:hypothetical protein
MGQLDSSPDFGVNEKRFLYCALQAKNEQAEWHLRAFLTGICSEDGDLTEAFKRQHRGLRDPTASGLSPAAQMSSLSYTPKG